MTPAIITLLTIICWAIAALAAQRLCSWGSRFVRNTAQERTKGWQLPALLVAVPTLAFAVATGICLLMVVRYGWRLAIIIWPDLAATLAPF